MARHNDRRVRTNRYLWFALGFISLFAGSLAALLLLNVSNTRIGSALNLALGVVATCAAAGGFVFSILGRKDSAPPTSPNGIYPPEPFPVQISIAGRDRQSSLESYVTKMQLRLHDLGMSLSSFVPLTLTADPDLSDDLLPELEWTNRGRRADYPRTESERIDLLDIPNRFNHVVLLGEPGSGKTTCLRRLALEELNRVSAWLQHHSLSTSIDETSLRLPLYASLSTWQPGISAKNFLRSQLQELLGAENYYVVHFDNEFSDGRFIFLLDGLNELPGRRANVNEGRHEQRGEHTNGPKLPGVNVASFDRRENELRDLASLIGLQSNFILTCRSHEYLDSYRWQTVRILPMRPDQIDQFINVYLADDRAPDLSASLHNDHRLAAIADNPFFLRAIIRIYEPGVQLNSRGQILTRLYKILLRNESARGAQLPAEPRLTRTIGRVAYRMLAAGKVGGQAPVGNLTRTELVCARALTGTGLLIERDGRFFFHHQIIQEFFAALGLNSREVRRKPKTLLADKRWSEVVALWCDLDTDRIPERVRAALMARNLPWRRPRSRPSFFLGLYQMLTSFAVLVVAAIYFWNGVLGTRTLLNLPLHLGGIVPLVLLMVALAVRLIWSCTGRHTKVIINSTYVLSMVHYPKALNDIVDAFSCLYHTEAAEVAGYVAPSFGSMALPYVMRGLGSSKWRVRAGCVQVLGELARSQPRDGRALEIMLAVSRAGDPQLMRSLLDGLSGYEDERVPNVVGEILSRSSTNGITLGYRLSPISKLSSEEERAWSDDLVAHFELLAAPNRPLALRAAALQTMGVLRIPDCEDRLGKVAEDNYEATGVRQSAVKGLGFVQTPRAVDRLVRLAEEYRDPVRKWACEALRQIRDPHSSQSLEEATNSSRWEVRQVVATALGATKGPGALLKLKELAEDQDYDVRESVARALSLVDLPEAVSVLGRLARDRDPDVRKAALEVMNSRYPHLVGEDILALAEDRLYPDRVRAIRSLAHYADPAIEGRVRNLVGDPDKRVREAAWEVLRLIRGASNRRPGRRVGTSLLGSARQRFVQWLQFDGYREMLRDERLSGVPEMQVRMNVQTKILGDAELTRRYRKLYRLYTFMLSSLIIAGVFAGVFACRLALWEIEHLISYWLYFVAVLALAALGFIPGFRWLRHIWGVRGLLEVSRLAALLLLMGTILAGILYAWWVIILGIGVVTALVLLVALRRRRRRGRHVLMALRSADAALAELS